MAVKLDIRNKIINGCFDFWQRGTSFTAPVSNTYVADRFVYAKNGAITHSITKSTDVPSAAFGINSISLACTAVSTLATTDFSFIAQRIEGNLLRSFKGKKMVLRFWVKSSKAGTYCVSLRNSANNRCYLMEYTVSSINTWEQKTLRFQHDTTGTWLYDTSIGMEVLFPLMVGTSSQGVLGWNNAQAMGTSNQTNICSSLSDVFLLTDIMLAEDGDDQTRSPDFSYAGRDYFEELRLCLRYYEKSTDAAVAPNSGAPTGGRQHGSTNTFTSATYQTANVEYLAVKRIAPAVTIYDGIGTANRFSILTSGGLVSAGNGLTPQSVNSGEKNFYVYMAPNTQTLPYFYWQADAEL